MTYHFVYCFDNLEHFFVCDLTVAIDIIKLEGPVELVLHLSSACDAQGANKFLKIDRPGFIAVKHVEHVVGE